MLGPVGAGGDKVVAGPKNKGNRRGARKVAVKPRVAADKPKRPISSAPPAPAAGEASRRPEVTVVGIGASAGGLTALGEFLRNVTEGSGLAYVVVVHLSPEHKSHLADLLQPQTAMPVLQVTETVELKPDCVYVIPPNANLSAIDTHLRLSPLEQRRIERAPIDHFFRTLAEQHDGHAIGVVLTGTGSDGTLGVKEIKLRGGLTVVQDPNEAEYDGMPQSAIATGFVDLVLPLSSIPGAVLRYARTEPRVPLGADGEAIHPDHRALLQKVLAQVRARTGRDFARYKHSTVMRRIRRRMQLRHIEELASYLQLLRQNPEEVKALADDLLITVTSFFRDPQVFARIEREIVPKLFEDRGPEEEIRIWCVGCATGEEVYSIAMLVLEEAGRRGGETPRLHVFASDLHDRSLQTARDGFYPGDIASEVSRERLKRFFTEETGGYRIRKEVRELVVFAPHNLLGDPPFSRLDMIVCRNLLIYLQRDVQNDVMRIFHYALRPGGYLVLGTSEGADDAELFRTVDKQLSIHRRGLADVPEPRLPVFPISHRHAPGTPQAPAPVRDPSHYLDLHDLLVRTFALPSVLVGPDGQVVHLSANAGRYLEHPTGRITTSAFRLVRQELSAELVTALHVARKERRATHSSPVLVRFNGDQRPVTMHVHPSLDVESEGYSLVIFEELAAGILAGPAPVEGSAEARFAGTVEELQSTRQRLQSLIEEFETTQEEMQASNEELQSANEELRSTMEELETSKEELQSMNEELQTVNQENRHKVAELAQLSGDLNNLLAATDIATLFLDREMRIQRFTPKIADIFSMRTTDRGRPVADLTHRLGYEQLLADAESVLRNLQPVEREVRDQAGRWYLTRLLPYRSAEDRIAGVVITFVDISRRKRSEEELHALSRDLEQRVQARTRQVRTLTSSLVRAEQSERRRLSETLHDDLQQMLYGAHLKLRLGRDALTRGAGEDSVQHLAQAEGLLARATQVTRQLSVDLNPPILRHEGLRAILEWLQGQMKELHELDVEIRTDGETRVEDSDARVLLFQVMRELLFNVAKHSGSKSAVAEVQERDGQLAITVADRGRGFDAQALGRDARDRPSVGLTSVRERVDLLGGSLAIESKPGQGARVTVCVPRKPSIGA
jgi:two-component system CheB/CheR fusion protein